MVKPCRPAARSPFSAPKASVISASSPSCDPCNEPAAGRESRAICRPSLSLAEAFPCLILDARYERVREAGVIASQAVLIAIGIDWDGRRQSLPRRRCSVPEDWRDGARLWQAVCWLREQLMSADGEKK
jgi:hypothetical protein